MVVGVPWPVMRRVLGLRQQLGFRHWREGSGGSGVMNTTPTGYADRRWSDYGSIPRAATYVPQNVCMTRSLGSGGSM